MVARDKPTTTELPLKKLGTSTNCFYNNDDSYGGVVLVVVEKDSTRTMSQCAPCILVQWIVIFCCTVGGWGAREFFWKDRAGFSGSG
jgi:hypothetical protein